MSGSATRVPSWWPVVGVVALLAVSNVMTNRVLPSPAYVPWGVAMTALLLGLAWADGCRWVDLGLGRERLGAGIGWGLSVFALVAAVYVLAVALPFSRDLFADDRVQGTGIGGAVYQVGFRIPLGTVLIEEVAFRGVLLAMVARRVGVAWGVVVSSLLFGLWHILPSLGIEATNPVLDDTLGDAAAGALVAVGGAVLGTALAGVVFCWLRLRSGSLLAPMMLHTATNSLGFLVAWLYLEGL
jgi:uncharacterized protein